MPKTVSNPLGKAQGQRVKNITPNYKPRIPQGVPPTGKTAKMQRPGGGSVNTKPSENVWGTPSRGGRSTINPTGINK